MNWFGIPFGGGCFGVGFSAGFGVGGAEGFVAFRADFDVSVSEGFVGVAAGFGVGGAEGFGGFLRRQRLRGIRRLPSRLRRLRGIAVVCSEAWVCWRPQPSLVLK